MTRFILAFMAGAMCCLAGFRHAAALKADALRLARWESLLKRLALLLQEGTLSIPQALSAPADESGPADDAFRSVAAKLVSAPMTTLEDAYAASASAGPESPTLARMFSRLGHGSKESRRLAVEQAADMLSLLSHEAAARAEKDVRLWQTLGLTGGICLTMMLL